MSASINGTTGVTFPDASTQNTAATGFGFKNRIINGSMAIDQRNAGASVTNVVGGVYTVDRFEIRGTQASKLTVQQSSTAPTGFVNSAVLTSSSAYSVVASDYFIYSQLVEGLNTADLAWGTASAATVTLSFWVRSSLTGTFGGSLRNSVGDRSYPFSYTVSNANTWEQKSVTIAGDTTGTWLTTNGIGIRLGFGAGVGSTYSGTAGAWAAGNLLSATGATSVVGTNGATFYITGVQLEKGSTATSFDYRPYGQELALCQRYYSKIVADSSYTGFANGYLTTTTQLTCVLLYPQQMRALPTASISNCGVAIGAGSVYPATLSGTYYGKNSANSNITFTGGSGTAGTGGLLLAANNTAAYIDYSAEL